MTAEEYFSGVRRHSVALQGYLRAIEDIESGDVFVSGGGESVHVAGGDVSNPVESELMARARMLDRLRESRDAALDAIGDALVVLEGVRAALGDSKADAVELHYIDCETWERVAAALGVSLITCKRWRSQAFEWLESQPMAYVVGLRGLQPSVVSVEPTTNG